MTTATVEADTDITPDTETRVMTARWCKNRHVCDSTGMALCGFQCWGDAPGEATCKACLRRRDADWYDEVAVERAIKRQPVGRRLTRAEQLAVARHVVARGGRTTAVQKRLRINGAKARELYDEVTGGGFDEAALDGAA